MIFHYSMKNAAFGFFKCKSFECTFKSPAVADLETETYSDNGY